MIPMDKIRNIQLTNKEIGFLTYWLGCMLDCDDLAEEIEERGQMETAQNLYETFSEYNKGF